MFGSTLLDVAIGISLVYLLFSLACSAVVESIAGRLRWRAKNFRAAICNLLDGVHANGSLQERFKAHPLIVSLSSQGDEAPGITKGWPSYLSADVFTTVAFDLVAGAGGRPITFWRLRDAVDSTTDVGGLKPVLRTLIHDVELRVTDNVPDADEQRLALLRGRVRAWYDEGMDRAGGWYKRLAQKSVLIVAIVLCLLLNLDTIAIMNRLATDPATRTAMVALATRTEAGTQPTDTKPADTVRVLAGTGLSIGWHAADWPSNRNDWCLVLPEKIVGLAVTVFALSLGAPFWFDILGRLVRLRAAGAKPVTALVDNDAATTPTAAILTGPAGTTALPATATVTTAAAALPADDWSQAARHRDLARVDPAAGPFVLANAVAMARAALLAYQDPAQLRQILTAAWDIPLDDLVVVDTLGEQAFAFATATFVVVAFRGTVPAVLETILADAQICLVEDPANPGNGRVHCGFLAAENAVGEPVETFLDKHADKPVFVTGHSLGAAMATVFAARFARTHADRIAGLYTFGSPRVGDTAFIRHLEHVLNGRSYRFVNDQDLVTRVAPRQFDYDHLNQVMYLDASGQLQPDGVGWTRFLNTVVDALGGFRTMAKQSFADHGMAVYVRKLENLL